MSAGIVTVRILWLSTWPCYIVQNSFMISVLRHPFFKTCVNWSLGLGNSSCILEVFINKIRRALKAWWIYPRMLGIRTVLSCVFALCLSYHPAGPDTIRMFAWILLFFSTVIRYDILDWKLPLRNSSSHSLSSLDGVSHSKRLFESCPSNCWGMLWIMPRLDDNVNLSFYYDRC